MIDAILKFRNWAVFGFTRHAAAGSADVLVRIGARHPDALLTWFALRAHCGRGRPRSQQRLVWHLLAASVFLACISSISAQTQTTTKSKQEGDKSAAGANPTREAAGGSPTKDGAGGKA